MKVGIDSLLLGAWVDWQGATSILDVGAGTGLLALMAAQRSPARIDAVEIEEKAAQEAAENFRNSPWHDRLQLFHANFLDFAPSTPYSHIISNPPYYNSQRPPTAGRALARHNETLSLQSLIQKAVALLTDVGHINLILPYDSAESLRITAFHNNLYISRLCIISPNENRKPHRIAVELSRQPAIEQRETLCISDAATGKYSAQYRLLTQDFYLRL